MHLLHLVMVLVRAVAMATGHGTCVSASDAWAHGMSSDIIWRNDINRVHCKPLQCKGGEWPLQGWLRKQ